ncbi:hypothetical protein ACHMP6_01590 [Candidatus Phytoplasma palmae]
MKNLNKKNKNQKENKNNKKNNLFLNIKNFFYILLICCFVISIFSPILFFIYTFKK